MPINLTRTYLLDHRGLFLKACRLMVGLALNPSGGMVGIIVTPGIGRSEAGSLVAKNDLATSTTRRGVAKKYHRPGTRAA